jgi:hypothetical protein
MFLPVITEPANSLLFVVFPNMASLYDEEFLDHLPNHAAGGPALIGCPPYLDTVEFPRPSVSFSRSANVIRLVVSAAVGGHTTRGCHNLCTFP